MKLIIGSLVILFSLHGRAQDKAKLADECNKDFSSHTSISDAMRIGLRVEDTQQLEQAKWFMSYVDRCGDYMDFMLKEKVISNRGLIKENIKAFEETISAKNDAISKCPNYNQCKEDLSKNYRAQEWFEKSEGLLSNLSLPVEAKAAHEFSKSCGCYVDLEGLRGKATIANQYMAKVMAQEKARIEEQKRIEAAKKEEAIKNAALQAEYEAKKKVIEEKEKSLGCQRVKAHFAYCKAKMWHRTATRILDSEARITARSGVVNLGKKDKYTRMQVTAEEDMENRQQMYKKSGGSGPIKCDLVEGPSFTMSFNESFRAKLKSESEKECGSDYAAELDGYIKI